MCRRRSTSPTPGRWPGQKLEDQLNANLAGMDVTRAKREPVLHIRYAGDVLKPVWFMSYRNRGRVAYAAIDGPE